MIVDIKFTEPHANGGYSVYTITVDDVEVAHVYGPMAAMAAESVCRYLEKGDESVRTGDIFERYRKNRGLPEPKDGVIYDDDEPSS